MHVPCCAAMRSTGGQRCARRRVRTRWALVAHALAHSQPGPSAAYIYRISSCNASPLLTTIQSPDSTSFKMASVSNASGHPRHGWDRRDLLQRLLIDPSTRSVSDVKHTIVAAASSSSSTRASEFLSKVGASASAKGYGSYEELVKDPMCRSSMSPLRTRTTTRTLYSLSKRVSMYAVRSRSRSTLLRLAIW